MVYVSLIHALVLALIQTPADVVNIFQTKKKMVKCSEHFKISSKKFHCLN